MKRSSFRVCILLAALAVLGRLTAFDLRVYFGLNAVPSHDMYQGAPFFATSMHALALTGDIAWWNPIANNGYAQYYQAFLSPLAPTPHSIVYIVWAQAVRAAALAGVRLPEYYQYLVINYLVLPFLAFLAVAALASLLFRRRAVVALCVIVYVFSSIGLWNGAWFYFQEPASLFFLLAAAIAALRMPSWPRVLLLLLATVNQATSVNYWTLYNSWFVAIVIGAFLLAHQRPLRRLKARALRQFAAARTTRAPQLAWLRLALVLGLASLATWGVIAGSIVAEQAGSYARSGLPEGTYRVDDAYQLIRPLRYYTIELFNPEVERPIRHYPVFEFPNPVHNGRYLGAVLLPLLMVFPFYRWRRREQWLVLATLGTLVVWLAPPWLLFAWESMPLMSGIQHVFYFYTHHWQLLLVLLAASAFDRVLGDAGPGVARRVLLVVCVCLAGVAVVFAVYWLFSSLLASDAIVLRAALRVGMLVLISCVLLAQRFLFDSRQTRRLLAGAVVLLAFADLTKYFYDVSRADREFTATFRFAQLWGGKVSDPLAGDIRERLKAAWAAPDPRAGFAGGIYNNMPIPNSFWPENWYVIHRALRPLDDPARRSIRDTALNGLPIEFFCLDEVRPLTADAPSGGALPPQSVLWLTAGASAPAGGARRSPDSDICAQQRHAFTMVWRTWSYNAFEFEIDAPADGFVMIRQLPDPQWRVTVNGQPASAVEANIAALAVPIDAGRHRLRMDYQPLARRLYWPAGVLLEATWIGVLAAAARARRR